jgi:hypothetical protein
MSNGYDVITSEDEKPVVQVLKLKKLRLEIEALEKSLSPDKATVWQKLNHYFQKNLGQISALIILFASFVTPVLNYISNQRQQQLVQVNSTVLEILLDSLGTNYISPANLLQISTQDPQVVAPLILDQLNKDIVHPEKAMKIYKRMYDVNQNLVKYTWTDRILFLFIDDNKTILEEELAKNATAQFGRELGERTVDIMKAYIDIIMELNLQDKSDFKKAFNVIETKCHINEEYKSLCDYIKRDKI